MQVIMLKDVSGVGQRGTLQNVSDGYALNYLIARGLAEQASPKKIAELKQREKADADAMHEREQRWADDAAKVNGQRLTVALKANEQGHLYTQLPADRVAAALQKEFNIVVPPDAIVINAPIKSVGATEIAVRFGKSTARITIDVIQAQ